MSQKIMSSRPVTEEAPVCSEELNSAAQECLVDSIISSTSASGINYRQFAKELKQCPNDGEVVPEFTHLAKGMVNVEKKYGSHARAAGAGGRMDLPTTASSGWEREFNEAVASGSVAEGRMELPGQSMSGHRFFREGSALDKQYPAPDNAAALPSDIAAEAVKQGRMKLPE